MRLAGEILCLETGMNSETACVREMQSPCPSPFLLQTQGRMSLQCCLAGDLLLLLWTSPRRLG